MRLLALFLTFALFPFTASAIEAPPQQTRINAQSVLRGRFVQQHRANTMKEPFSSSGHYVVAPANGLIWSVEKPFPTSTIVTPEGAAQDIGGLAIKLPIRNLRSLYEMVGGALAGNWSAFEKDFVVKFSGDTKHWKMLLTPREARKPTLPYANIAVSGGPFVEKILMTKADGAYDAMEFTEPVLSPAPLAPMESAAFNKVMP